MKGHLYPIYERPAIYRQRVRGRSFVGAFRRSGAGFPIHVHSPPGSRMRRAQSPDRIRRNQHFPYTLSRNPRQPSTRSFLIITGRGHVRVLASISSRALPIREIPSCVPHPAEGL
jgi:hypothetical protein